MDDVRWITLGQAVAILAPKYGEIEAKSLILERARDNLLKKRIARLKLQGFKTSVSEFEVYARQLRENCEIEPIFDAGGYALEFDGDFEINTTENAAHYFAGFSAFADSNKSWVTTQYEHAVNQYYADWEISEFKYACLSHPQLGHFENYSIRTMHAIGIEVEAEFVERLVPVNLAFNSTVSVSNRVSKYDWGAAMSHLVAIAEFDSLVSDANAHGAQAEVEKTMADWFSLNSEQQPSEAAIRNYAAKVMTAVKAFRTKG